jgi:hypothetical protein
MQCVPPLARESSEEGIKIKHFAGIIVFKTFVKSTFLSAKYAASNFAIISVALIIPNPYF